MQQQTHYQLPDNTDTSIRRMVVGLCVFFVCLMLAVGLIFYHAQSIARHIPFSAEQRFVRPYENLISRFFSSASGEQEIQIYLQQLADSMKQNMQIQDDIVIKVHYVDSDLVNAFATLGGHIVLFRGLLEALPDENSLAMVLAHEIAHVAHRDPVAAVGRGIALQMIFGFFTGGGPSAENTIDLVGGSGMALFSREQERNADIKALHTLNTHYGHVNGYRTFFEVAAELDKNPTNDTSLKSDEKFDMPDWLASHPAIEERLLLLDEEREKLQSPLGRNRALPTAVTDILAEK